MITLPVLELMDLVMRQAGLLGRSAGLTNKWCMMGDATKLRQDEARRSSDVVRTRKGYVAMMIETNLLEEEKKESL